MIYGLLLFSASQVINNYLVIFYEFPQFLWTYPLRLKSDTFRTLSYFFALVST